MRVRIHLELVGDVSGEDGEDYLHGEYEAEYVGTDGYASCASDLYMEIKSLFSAWVESKDLAL